MALGTKDGALIVKDGTLAQDCNCCGPGMCCKEDKHCTTVKASQCPASVGVWTSSRYGIVCPPSGCCCGPSQYALHKWANCLEGGCRPEQIDISFSFAAPRKFFAQDVPSQNRVYYWQHAPVTFTGSVTLVRFPENLQGPVKNYVLYYVNIDPSQGFANASALSLVFNAQNLTAQFQFLRKCTSTTLTQEELCNEYLPDTGSTSHRITAGYGTMTTDTTPYNPSDRLNNFIKEYMYWTADLTFSETAINSNCFCYGSTMKNGSTTQSGSSTEESYIDYSVLSLPCSQRPSVINGQPQALDALVTSTNTSAATLTITDAR
jgi:hypothetical protein